MKTTITVEFTEEEYEEYKFIMKNKYLISKNEDIFDFLDKAGYMLISRRPFQNPFPAANDPLGRPEGERFVYEKDKTKVFVEVKS